MIPERASGGKGAVAGMALEWCLLQPVDGLVDSELARLPELPVTLVTGQQLVGVALLRLLQLVAQLMPLKRLRSVETFIAGAAGERLLVARHVLQQLVFLVEAFLTELTEEPLLLVQLPPPPPLLLLLLLLTQSCSTSTTGGQTGPPEPELMLLCCPQASVTDTVRNILQQQTLSRKSGMCESEVISGFLQQNLEVQNILDRSKLFLELL